MRIKSAKYSKGVPPDQGTKNIFVVVSEEGTDMKHWVPLTEDNADYRAVLEWVAKGNTIADAD
jgi:hypothetical protein|tara:strand:- start:652 stop:840 length:189 start_codon:yes stop_codon:yes gene_type:complete